MIDWADDDRIWRLRMRQADRAASDVRRWRYVVALVLAGTFAAWVGYVPAPLPDPKTPTTVAAVPAATVPDALAALVEMDAAILAGVSKAEDANAAAAVQWVLLNRAGCEFLDGSVYECKRALVDVATEGQAFGTVIGGRYRASWWPGRTWARAADHAQLAEVEGTAHAVLAGYVPDPTGGATHYHRLGTWTPSWAPPSRTWRTFGSHAFYRAR